MSDNTNMASIFDIHMAAIEQVSHEKGFEEATSTPLFTGSILQHFQRTESGSSVKPFAQHGLLGGVSNLLQERQRRRGQESVHDCDPRLFVNLSHPLSIFICGSQGSGKIHTLSCLLENCLIPSALNILPNPLTGIVFHYDAFISDTGGSPCEAAYLSSDPSITVRVLCSPTNVSTTRVSSGCKQVRLAADRRKRTYSALNVTVEPLRIKETDLNPKRMLDLMSVKQEDGPSPLYIQTVLRILREMRIEQQNDGSLFSYKKFKDSLLNAGLSPAQIAPLQQRLDTLKSFMQSSTSTLRTKMKTKNGPKKDSDWSPKVVHHLAKIKTVLTQR